jgi:restriction endonuclease S subunit
MNWEFRKLIRRSTPKGRLSPIAEVLKNLQAKLPTFETQQLIPNALLPQTSQTAKSQELCLNVKARRHDAFAALFIELEGTLDHLNARELLTRIKQAAQDAKMDIVVNFEHLKQATPKAIQTLLDGEILKAITPHANLRYRKLKESFQASVDEMAIGDWDIFDETPRHA